MNPIPLRRKAAVRPGKAEPEPSTEVDFGLLRDSVGFALRRAQLAVMGAAIGKLAPLELRPAQLSVLVLIEANPDLPQSNLSAALGIARPNFVAMLDELESRGLAKRCVSSRDRRINTLVLTEAGKSALRDAARLHATYEAELDARLGPGGREQLAALLAKLQ